MPDYSYPAFLASELTEAESNPDTALFEVIPCPLEKTVSYGAGTGAGPSALLEASQELERFDGKGFPLSHGIITSAPIDCDLTIEEVMIALRRRTASSIKAGRIPLTLGGEHSLSYGAIMGVVDALQKPVGIIQIDAHADLRVAYQGQKHSHASVMHLCAVEEKLPLMQLGIRALCSQEHDSRLAAPHIHFVDAEELVTGNITKIDLPNDFPQDVYITFDVDGLDPSIMPATGTPVPGGLGYYQSLSLIEHALKGRRCVGIDVVELAPMSNQWAWDFTAANLTYRLMALAGHSKF
ncbi:agmatinase family protein [Cohaesibacter celericrescens]|uniref:Agmatinase n=1 Tax=Cohaesibacter celericrescens TaxID=2067669 RepID=A0A2N5XM65_9HYPH|nr:agmatinase family protein [Cohaesibacter celericrescens]PLW75584.1 agmatinase [Cohaesibacter celericrescens]